MSKSVVIVGASSGIGAQLAMQYAQAGYNLGLCARRTDSLEELKHQINSAYPHCRCLIERLDVSALDSVPGVLNAFAEQLGSLDIVIANAGITGVRRTGSGDLSTDLQIIQVNLLGAIATIDAAAAIFRKQGHGHIVGISSFSAFRGIPGSAAYSASKAALSNYLEAVRTELYRKNIQVTAIHPGFIKTDLSSHMEKYPFVISAEQGAKAIFNAIKRQKKNATIPAWPWVILKHLIRALPDSVIAKIF